MSCYPTVQRRAAKKGVQMPAPQTENEKRDLDLMVRDMIGATSHEDSHRIMDRMTDDQIAELAKKILERRKKRAQVLQSYLETQGLVPAYAGAGVA